MLSPSTFFCSKGTGNIPGGGDQPRYIGRSHRDLEMRFKRIQLKPGRCADKGWDKSPAGRGSRLSKVSKAGIGLSHGGERWACGETGGGNWQTVVDRGTSQGVTRDCWGLAERHGGCRRSWGSASGGLLVARGIRKNLRAQGYEGKRGYQRVDAPCTQAGARVTRLSQSIVEGEGGMFTAAATKNPTHVKFWRPDKRGLRHQQRSGLPSIWCFSQHSASTNIDKAERDVD